MVDPIVDLQISTPEKPSVSPHHWGPWATIGWTLLCILVLAVAELGAELIFDSVRIAKNPAAKRDDPGINGNALAFATLLGTAALVGSIAFLIRIRGYPIRDYLTLNWPPARSVAIALLGLAVVLVGTDLISYLLGRPLVPPFMIDVYRTAWLPALVLAVVVLGPVGEETLFRGFLYTGIASSRVGPIGAIIVSTAVFALLHVQYDWFGVGAVAVIGIYLAIVRYGYQSLYLTILLHAIGNAFSTLEVVAQEHWLK